MLLLLQICFFYADIVYKLKRININTSFSDPFKKRFKLFKKRVKILRHCQSKKGGKDQETIQSST